MKTLEILYAGNDKMFDGLYLSILTMLNRTKSILHFTILTGDFSNIKKEYVPLSQKHINVLFKLIKKFNLKNNLRVIDCTDIYIKNIDNITRSYMFTPYSLLRLFLINYYTNQNVLYLDVDTLISGDIKTAFDININNFEMCVCNDKAIGWKNSGRYFNSGVILFNIKMIKQTLLMNKVLDYCKKAKNIKFLDQDALNACVTKFTNWKNQYNFNFQRFRVKKNIVIVHFAYYKHKPKPWDIKHFSKYKRRYHWNIWDNDYLIYFDMKKSLKEKVLN